MIVYKGTIGVVKRFQCLYKDGEPYQGLNGADGANLVLEDRDGNVLTKALDITSAGEGYCELSLTSDITLTVRRWKCTIKPYIGSTMLEPSDPFYMDVQDSPG